MALDDEVDFHRAQLDKESRAKLDRKLLKLARENLALWLDQVERTRRLLQTLRDYVAKDRQRIRNLERAIASVERTPKP